jgi:hypothetical protein
LVATSESLTGGTLISLCASACAAVLRHDANRKIFVPFLPDVNEDTVVATDTTAEALSKVSEAPATWRRVVRVIEDMGDQTG